MNKFIMTTWSNPCNADDKRQLCSWVYDTDMGWIGKRFDTEEEAKKASEIYVNCIRNNSIPEDAKSIIDTIWYKNRFIKLKKGEQ